MRSTSWLKELTGDQRAELEALLAERLPAAEIYRRLRLHRYVSPGAFRRWRKTGAAPEGRPASAAQPGAPPSIEALIEASLRTLHQAVLAQSVPEYALPRVLTALAGLQRLAIEEQAERRAAELHELKLTQLRQSLRQAVEAASQSGAEPLTREAVYDLVDQVMRGAA